MTGRECAKLVAAGAADGSIQVIRTHHGEEPLGIFSFSERCERCKRWVWCGRDEREDACVCGHRYRVVFDLPPVLHWTQKRGQCCMDCGAENTFTQPHEGRNPWHPVSVAQIRCNACHLANAVAETGKVRGVLSNRVLATSPITGDPAAINPKDFADYADADRAYTQLAALRQRAGTPGSE